MWVLKDPVGFFQAAVKGNNILKAEIAYVKDKSQERLGYI